MKKSRKQQQRLLRNMGAHAVVLELLQIPYEKVNRPLARGCAPRGIPLALQMEIIRGNPCSSWVVVTIRQFQVACMKQTSQLHHF